MTKSAAGAAAIGLGVRSLASEGLKYATRSVHREEQDAIARIAGPLAPGAVAAWSVNHRIPLEDDEHGDVVVTRAFGAGSLQCKELVFSVERTRRQRVERAFYLTTVCQDGARWRWASAEPATGALGRAAMRVWALVVLPLLGGCAVVADVAGLVAGGAAGSATANPVVGYAVGITVRAGVDELRRYVVRRRQQGEQDSIAAVAGGAPVGENRYWEIRHTVPIGNERGTLTVVREIATPLATCREVVFVVEGDGVFTTPICLAAGGWKWAAAEPAVDRWGHLQ